ncbi:hypothetical protein [Chryseobacterium sp. JK1]|uniref:hypothetical protein n=1 Tax=Chryseobacterium sp. JK1 TaxID=874294 RepID=UPI003D68D923
MVRKLGKVLLVIILGCFLFMAGKFLLIWNSVEVDNSLSHKTIFKTFNQQKQASLWHTKSKETKTNNFRVKYDSLSPKYFDCYIYKDPLLKITFSVGDGFSGGGYQIDIIQNRYKVSLYSYTDIIKPFDFLNTEEAYKVLKSRLILDKDSYKKGDSLFGYAELTIQRGYGHQKQIEEGKGYFKGIVN